ncbi:hypothetical protein [Thermosulfuriphilus sp.]
MSQKSRLHPSAEILNSGFDIFLPYPGKRKKNSVSEQDLEAFILKDLKAGEMNLEGWLKKIRKKKIPVRLPEAFFEKDPSRRYDIRIAPLAKGFLISGAEIGPGPGAYLYQSAFFEKVLNRMGNLVSALSGRIDLLRLKDEENQKGELNSLFPRLKRGLGEILAFFKALALYQHHLGQREETCLNLDQVILEVVEFMEMFTFREGTFFFNPSGKLPSIQGRKGDFTEALCLILASIVEASSIGSQRAIFIQTGLAVDGSGLIEFRYDGHKLSNLASLSPIRRLRRLYGVKLKTMGLSGDQRIALLIPL